jgi:hypothetical protein
MHWRVIAGKLTIVNTKKIGIASGEKTNERDHPKLAIRSTQLVTTSESEGIPTSCSHIISTIATRD